MNINELVYDLKEHLDTYCQTYDDYTLSYNEVEMLYDLINRLERENIQYKGIIIKARELLEKGITFCKNDSQGAYNICNMAINREKEILKVLKGGYE